MNLSTSIDNFVLRGTTKDDCPLILNLIMELAEYEKLAHEVVATVETLKETLFGENAYAEFLSENSKVPQ